MAERLLDGRYLLRSILGRGGTALVWLADDQRLGRRVAVKVLDRAGLSDPTMVARFDREARTVARLAHANIVTVHDVGVDDGVPYLVMELVDGRSLAELLVDGPLDVGRAVEVAAQICDALDAAHTAGVIHRDVKPANILITAAGAVKVCDFGIARARHQAQVSMTGAATVIGTSEYMAPEQVVGGPVDHRADLYALGGVLYAMLTGLPPFSGETPVAVAWQHLHQALTPVTAIRRNVPVALDALVTALLSKNPADRPSTAGQVRARLPQVPFQPTRTLPAVASLPAPADGSIRAQAAVHSRTQTMPVFDVADEPGEIRSGFRLGPAGIAGVALGAAVLAVLGVAAFTGVGPTSQAGSMPDTPSALTSAPAASTPSTGVAQPADTPEQAIVAVRVALDAQVAAGQLDPNAAQDLKNQLADIENQIADGGPAKVAEKVASLRKKLFETRKAGDVTDAGFNAVLAALDQLAATLPAGKKGHD